MRERLLEKLEKSLGFPLPVYKSFDLIGDIVVLRARSWALEPESVERAKLVAEALLRELPYVKAVLLAATPVEGEYRVRKVLHLAGEKRTTTIYKEHGCAFRVDVSEVYVSPRLSHERMRLAKLVKPGEVVTNMFAGAGLFSIVIAKHSQARVVYSIDKNPRAYELMVENTFLNRVEDRVVPLLGDCREVVKAKLAGSSDRVLMPLPSFSEDFYKHAVLALKERGGVLHAYEFVELGVGEKKSQLPLKAFAKVKELLERAGAEAELLGGRIVRSVGPRLYQVSLDVKAKPTRS